MSDASYLAKFRDALCGPRAPGEENDTFAETGLCTQVGATVTINDFDNSVCKLLPALALMRSSRSRTHRQAGIEHQYAGLGPCGKVPLQRKGGGGGGGENETALGPCASHVVGRKKKKKKEIGSERNAIIQKGKYKGGNREWRANHLSLRTRASGGRNLRIRL